MSDLAPGSLSLEDENPSLESLSQPQEPPAPAETPQEAAQTPPPADEPEPDGTVVNPNGEKLVPLSALAAKRQEASSAKAALAEKEAKIAELEAKAQQLEQIKGDWQRVQPLIQRFQSGQLQPPAPQAPQVNEAAIKYAKDFDLYKTDGTPDVDRAQRIMDFHAAQAREQAQQLVQPLYQQTAQQQSQTNFQAALGFKDKNGIQVDKTILQEVWNMMPPEMTANPQIAKVLYKVAYADTIQAMGLKPAVQAPPPPLVTESLGGNTAPPRELTAIDRAMMSAGSIKAKDYESISANFKPGQTNSLE